MTDHAEAYDPGGFHRLGRAIVLCLAAAVGGMLPAIADDGPRPTSLPVAQASTAVPRHWQGTPAEKEVARLLDDVLAHRTPDYRAAVEQVLHRQALFCDGEDRLDRVTIHTESKGDGETALTLHSEPGRNGCGDTLSHAMTLRDGAVVGLAFSAESAIDQCPCMQDVDADYLDAAFLDVVSRIDTLGRLDLSSSCVTGEGLRSIARLPGLKALILQQVNLLCDDLEPLGAHHRLEELWYSHADPDVRQPARFGRLLARHPMLREVHVQSVELTREAATAIASCSRLEILDVHGSWLGPGALDAFATHERLTSLSIGVTTDAREPIVLRGMPALRFLGVYVHGPEVEIAVASLPALRRLSLSATRDAPAAPEGHDAPETIAETGHAPRIAVDGLSALEALHVSLVDRQANVAAEAGEVRLAGLPALTTISLFDLDGKLDLRDDLSALTTIEGLVADPAIVYRSLPRCPNVERLDVRHSIRDGRERPALDAAAIAPVFDLARLMTLELNTVRGRPLTFEPFLRLPRLKTLILNDCDVAASFGADGHPTLEWIRLQGVAARDVTLRGMPRLSRVSIWKAGQLETVTLIDCPALESCSIGNSPNLTKLDLREANAKADVETRHGDIDESVILRPDRTAKPGAAKPP